MTAPTPSIASRTTGGVRVDLVALNARSGQTVTAEEARAYADALRDLAALVSAMR